jgi:hypothetical protein
LEWYLWWRFGKEDDFLEWPFRLSKKLRVWSMLRRIDGEG